VNWPRFRQVALTVGIQASLSIPLFAGSGGPVAALNLYSRQPAAFVAMAAQLTRIYNGHAVEGLSADIDAGGRDLLTGVADAFLIRDTIQQAIGGADETGEPDVRWLLPGPVRAGRHGQRITRRCCRRHHRRVSPARHSGGPAPASTLSDAGR